MEEPVKGTVTSLSSLVPAEEAQKASRRVLDAIYERREQLDQLKSFVADNTNLVNLVQKLPEELHHDIMVPFGKAAFFPGRLIHTNEFLVLLGEGYYAERTSKQTVEFLKRRGKVLESQVESLKAVMQDLKAEASFFDATAAEAVEGVVEIREDYVEELSPEKEKVSIAGRFTALIVAAPISAASFVFCFLLEHLPISIFLVDVRALPLGAQSDSPSFAVADNMEAGSVDEEYTHILSIMDKLEKEEEETENANEHSEDEQDDSVFGQRSPDHEVKSSEISAPSLHSKAESMTREDTFKNFFQQDFSDRLDDLSYVRLDCAIDICRIKEIVTEKADIVKLSKWVLEINVGKDGISVLGGWIGIEDLPFHLWKEDIFRKIGE
ncbi:unnamed protein product [Ilex paraguariensis]|uniref:RNA polymerase II subunit 5-mediating protein homolog n=1 Tax=Ilex paraguariensis TaxID=185542 RepID=A0ABC8RS78_9AQUA